MVAILLGADNGFFYAGQIMHFSSPFTVLLIYHKQNFADIQGHANDIEERMDDSDLDPKSLIRENERNLALCRQFGCEYILIDEEYNISI